MKKYVCSGPLMVEIRMVRPEELIEPKKADGNYEPIEKMSHFEKQAFTVMMRLHRRITELSEAIKGGHLKAGEVGRAKAEARCLQAKRNKVEELMFFSIRDRLDRWEEHLDVSQGWKVIIPEEEAAPKLFEVFLQPDASDTSLASILQSVIGEALVIRQARALSGPKSLKVNMSGNGTLH